MLLKKQLIVAGHDVGSGGLITSLLEICFPSKNIGAELDFSSLNEKDSAKLLFNENISVILQAENDIEFEQFSLKINIQFLIK